MACETLNLSFGLQFADLYDRRGLQRIDAHFIAALAAAAPALAERLGAARATPDAIDRKAESELVTEIAPHLEDFIGALFGIAGDLAALRADHDAQSVIFSVKRLFVQRRALKAFNAAQAATLDGAALADKLAALFGAPLTEASYARHVSAWMEAEAEHADALETASAYAAWATLTPKGRHAHRRDVIFRAPEKRDAMSLVPLIEKQKNDIRVLMGPEDHRREREGFKLTDRGASLVQSLDQANYCIWCHKQGKDSCALGLKDRKSGAYEKNAFGATLLGCPLDEHISEMNLLKAQGRGIAALAAITLANPLCAATGHRICNDCVKACIYQKQQPVDIPQIESRTLKDVLALPFGFEIYSLLTRWNPLNVRRPVPLPPSGRQVLVVGLGPAGFTLAHHLINDGHTVVGIDGLKIEPLPEHLTGVAADGTRTAFAPIRAIADIYEELDARAMAGFGGVAEYGITVRWDKNNLKLIRLLLQRREAFSMHGGVRMGGTLTLDDAFAMGFDHVALCMGAGKPTVIPMKNGLAHGVRQASDFLMALQLTGAAKTDSLANLTVRLPIAVIGGGLTAIDTATEALAYYPLQVEKFLARYETLLASSGADALSWSPDEAPIAEEFLRHGRALRAEREAAAREGREARISALLEEWGGATIVYRRKMVESPSYTLNHEEIEKAMEEHIGFAECLAPVAVDVDELGHATALLVKPTDAQAQSGGAMLRLPARTILVAAGTQPNTVLAREDSLNIRLDGKYFQAVDEDGAPVTPERSCKPAATQVLMSPRADGRFVSFFGDLHPSFAGNVVKAMASATRGYGVISRVMAAAQPAAAADALPQRFAQQFQATVSAVHRLTPTIVEVVLHAPAAARAFKPGQFFRFQNYEAGAPLIDSTRLATEALALTGAWVDRDKGLVSVIVLEMGGSSNLCATMQVGERVVLMGPTGEPTHVEGGETYILAGGGLGNAVLFSIGQEARARGARTLYFAGYKRPADRFKIDQIESAADIVVWCSDEAPGITPSRPQDLSFVGNIVDAMAAYAAGALGAAPIALAEARHLIAIGSDGMMAALARARDGRLKPHLDPALKGIASINSPMQCMMKEICGQCLQMQRSPETGEETVVFTCACQDQPLEAVDFGVLRARLRQNSVQEQLTRRWIAHCQHDMA